MKKRKSMQAIWVISCPKCGAENSIDAKEKGQGKTFFCPKCKSFFFQIGPGGELVIQEINIA